MTYPLFFGCLLVAFGPLFAVFCMLIAPNDQMVILTVGRFEKRIFFEFFSFPTFLIVSNHSIFYQLQKHLFIIFHILFLIFTFLSSLLVHFFGFWQLC